MRRASATPRNRVAAVCLELAARLKHKVKRIHFVGIGGAGMSGIAEVLVTQGYQVTGSDLAEECDHATPGATRRVDCDWPHGAKRRRRGRGVVSTAVVATNPEVVAAREHGVPVVPRALMLAELMRLKQGIAVAARMARPPRPVSSPPCSPKVASDPTFVIGGRLLSADANARLGKGEFLVAEADESDASFLYLSPVLAVVTKHRRRSHGDLRPRFREAQACVRRFPATTAVLRRGGRVR
jgi:UDP-N-acetylmuramate--alanine ligase